MPFEILERVGLIAYRLALPLELLMIHSVFHVSMLRKYLPNPSHVLSLPAIQLDENLSYEEEPIAIVDRQVKKLHSEEVPVVKLIWRKSLRRGSDLGDRGLYTCFLSPSAPVST